MSDRVLYNGRMVAKAGFRAYIYSENNDQKLVNSWDEFERNIASGLWFPNKKGIQPLLEPKNDNKKKRKDD